MRLILSAILSLFVLAACSSLETEPAVVSIPEPSPTLEALMPSPTVKPIGISATPTLLSTATSQFVSTGSLTATGTEDLPKLKDVLLSASDVESIAELDANPLIAIEDVTDELQNSCLWECAKYRYSLKHSVLTIVLLRAGDPQKAQSTVQNLRNDFLPSTLAGGYEYVVNDIPNLPANAWAMVDSPSSTKDTRTGSSGVSVGSIVILVTYSQSFCEDLPTGGRYCEGNMMDLVWNSVNYLLAQMNKLEYAGYPN